MQSQVTSYESEEEYEEEEEETVSIMESSIAEPIIEEIDSDFSQVEVHAHLKNTFFTFILLLSFYLKKIIFSFFQTHPNLLCKIQNKITFL